MSPGFAGPLWGGHRLRARGRRTPGLARIGAVCGLLTMLLGGCGPVFRDGVFENGQVRYRVDPTLEGLQPLSLDQHDVAFRLERGTIGVSSRCDGYEDVPPRALLLHLLFGTTERNRVLDETVTVDGRGALHVVEEVELDGVPVVLDIFVLPKDGCLFDFVYVAPRPLSPEAAGRYRSFVHSFALLEVKD